MLLAVVTSGLTVRLMMLRPEDMRSGAGFAPPLADHVASPT
jgi:hypothetical protein